MAWVEKRPQGWVIRWRDEHGKHASGAYGSRAEARIAADELEQRTAPARRRRKPGERPVEPLTIGQIADLWLQEALDDEERMRRPGAREYLDEAVAAALAAASQLGWVKPSQATRVSVLAWRKARKGRGVNRPGSYLRAILRWGHAELRTPLDEQADTTLCPPPSRKANVDLLTDRQARAIMARARRYGLLPVFSCLAIYGWRPITACRLNVGDVDLRRAVIRIGIKHDGEPWEHALFPFHVRMLAPLVAGRDRAAPLFLSPMAQRRHKNAPPRGQRWTNAAMGQFYRDNLSRGCRGAGNVYALKRFALTRMKIGAWPWSARLDIPDIQLVTGQKSAAMVSRYLVTNVDRMRRFMSGSEGASVGQMGK